MNEDLRILGTVLVALAVIPAFGVLWEISRTDWFHGPNRRVGRVLFSKSLIIALVLTNALIGASLMTFGLGRPTWFEVFRLCVFGAIVPVLYWQWWAYRHERQSASVNDLTFDSTLDE